jgi:hypothetical protein
MLYLQCFYSTAQTLTSDISISTKMDMYHYKTRRNVQAFAMLHLKWEQIVCQLKILS